MTEEIPLTREFTVDERFPGRASWALVTKQFYRPGILWAYIFILAAGLGFSLLKPESWFGWSILSLGLIGTVVLPAVAFFAVKRATRRQYPTGSLLQTGFGAERFAVASPTISATLDYSMFSRGHRRGDFVFLRQAATKTWNLYPGVLFDDADLARFPQS